MDIRRRMIVPSLDAVRSRVEPGRRRVASIWRYQSVGDWNSNKTREPSAGPHARVLCDRKGAVTVAWRSQETRINAWWEKRPGECYWLDVTERDDRGTLLAAPRGEGRSEDSWRHQLITHVKSGDVVFHYDASQGGITACSVAKGAVGKKELDWPLPGRFESNGVTSQRLPSWGIRLERSTELAAAVPLEEIARTQSCLFPSLRALEEEVGDPLYYPFEMGSPHATHPLSGFVFKLPGVFVFGFPELARAAEGLTRPLPARERSPSSWMAPVTHLHPAAR